jgi:hypothetical protein
MQRIRLDRTSIVSRLMLPRICCVRIGVSPLTRDYRSAGDDRDPVGASFRPWGIRGRREAEEEEVFAPGPRSSRSCTKEKKKEFISCLLHVHVAISRCHHLTPPPLIVSLL